MFNAVSNIKAMEKYVEGKGKKFVLTIAPNKNTLYPENMPNNYKKVSEKNNLSKLEKVLKKEKINYVDLKSVFKNEDEVLYLKRDSHWNNKGALLAYNSI